MTSTEQLPGRKRSMDQDIRIEHIGTFATLILTIPLIVVAVGLLFEGGYLHLVYAACVAVPAILFVVMALIRERTVLPAPHASRRKKPGIDR